MTLAVMDIVPTHAMFMATNRTLASAYWYWYFLAQPEPFPESLSRATRTISMRRAWSAGALPAWPTSTRKCSPAMGERGAILPPFTAAVRIIAPRGASICSMTAPISRYSCGLRRWRNSAPSVSWRALFDIWAQRRKRCSNVTEASAPGRHFFVDQFPGETAATLLGFVAGRGRRKRRCILARRHDLLDTRTGATSGPARRRLLRETMNLKSGDRCR